MASGNCPSFCAETFGVQNSPFWPVFLQFNLSGVLHVIPSLCPFQGLATVLDNLASVWTVALTSQAREESRPGKGGRVELLFFFFLPPFFFFSSILNNFLQENLGAHVSAPVHRASTPCLCILCAETQPGRPWKCPSRKWTLLHNSTTSAFEILYPTSPSTKVKNCLRTHPDLNIPASLVLRGKRGRKVPGSSAPSPSLLAQASKARVYMSTLMQSAGGSHRESLGNAN